MRLVLLALFGLSLEAGCVATAAYNGQRTGATTSETTLTAANVGSISKVGSWSVDDQIFGQPLICNGYVYVATAGGTIYKFDAAAPGSAAIWSVNAGTPVTITDHTGFAGHQGCIATPVIDEPAGVIYATCLDATNGWRIFALNMSDGSNFHSPVAYSGSHQGRTFSSSTVQTRTAHLLHDGYVYVGFNGYSDFSGWVFKIDKSSLASTAYSTGTTNGGSAGVWMGNGGPSVDGNGKVYVTTANGDWNGTTQLGESLVRFDPATFPAVDDFFTPSSWATINGSDSDFGVGPAVIFGSHVITATKNGLFWRFGTSSLGGLQGSGGTEEQTFSFGDSFQFNRIAYANSNMYAGGNPSRYAWNGTTFATSPTATGTGGCKINSYSSNADASGSKVLWCLSNGGTQSLTAGRLVAYDADSMATLWSSNTAGGDALGNWGKWAQAVVESGRVYVATFSNTVVVYGFPTTVSGTRSVGPVTRGGPGTIK